VHIYKYLVTIKLPCSECGQMNIDVLSGALEELPSKEIFVEEIDHTDCQHKNDENEN
jgi:hypothetical protein